MVETLPVGTEQWRCVEHLPCHLQYELPPAAIFFQVIILHWKIGKEKVRNKGGNQSNKTVEILRTDN